MKKKSTKKLVLAVPNLDKKIRMEVDISDYAMGEILFIECENKK